MELPPLYGRECYGVRSVKGPYLHKSEMLPPSLQQHSFIMASPTTFGSVGTGQQSNSQAVLIANVLIHTDMLLPDNNVKQPSFLPCPLCWDPSAVTPSVRGVQGTFILPCGKRCPGPLWLLWKHHTLPPLLWADSKIKEQVFHLRAGYRGITWPHILVVKWAYSPHHFSKSHTWYLWACWMAQAALEPAAVPAPVQIMGESPTLWWSGDQDTQLCQWDARMNGLEHAKSLVGKKG